MKLPSFAAALVAILWQFIIPIGAQGAEVLKFLPSDALGFVLVRNIGTADGKLQRLGATLQLAPLGPLGFLRVATGISEGLDPNGDFLLALLQNETEDGQPKFCVWLPVSDSQKLLTSLGGDPSQAISAVTIAGEELLAVKHDKWVLLMDPDQRARMELMLIAATHSRSFDLPWQKWIDLNDVTVVALAGGVETVLRSVLESPLPAPHAATANSEIDLFGPADGSVAEPDVAANIGTLNGVVSAMRRGFGELQAAMPQFVELIDNLQAIGCGLRIDDNGHAILGIRTKSNNATSRSPSNTNTPSNTPSELPPGLFSGGEFILKGATQAPNAVTPELVTAYLRFLVNQLRTEERIRLDEQTLSRFYEAVGQAAGEATAASVLTLPGEKQDGVYTNRFLAVRVRSADTFVDLATEAMRLWNQMNRDARGGTRLVFDVEELTLGKRKATQYSLDIAEADAAPVLPEMRQAMEKLFGPGGKLRMVFVKLDDHTALLAGATAEQVSSMLAHLDRKLLVDWQQPPLAEAHQLLPASGDWRLFFSPHGYTSWKSRESDAIVGTEVIGGPLVKEFPASPPIGIAGGRHDGELWIDMAIQDETIRSAGSYLRTRRVVPQPR